MLCKQIKIVFCISFICICGLITFKVSFLAQVKKRFLILLVSINICFTLMDSLALVYSTKLLALQKGKKHVLFTSLFNSPTIGQDEKMCISYCNDETNIWLLD